MKTKIKPNTRFLYRAEKDETWVVLAGVGKLSVINMGSDFDELCDLTLGDKILAQRNRIYMVENPNNKYMLVLEKKDG